MTAPFTPPCLPPCKPFLSAERQWQEGQLRRAFARFDPKADSAALAEAAGLALPAFLDRASPRRRASYLAGRLLIRSAAPGAEPAMAPDGAPIWPPGWKGSISHAGDRCACLLAPEGIGHPGIDIEPVATDRACDAILSHCLTPAEHQMLVTPCAATLAFSAKEALFKALYPRIRRFLNFDTARLIAPPQDGRLHLELTTDLGPHLPDGRCFCLRYEISREIVTTWVIVPEPVTPAIA